MPNAQKSLSGIGIKMVKPFTMAIFEFDKMDAWINLAQIMVARLNETRSEYGEFSFVDSGDTVNILLEESEMVVNGTYPLDFHRLDQFQWFLVGMVVLWKELHGTPQAWKDMH